MRLFGLVMALVVVSCGQAERKKDCAKTMNDIRCTSWKEKDCGLDLWNCNDGQEYSCANNVKWECL